MSSSKLTKEIVDTIRKLHETEKSLIYRDIADLIFEEFNVRISIPLISNVISKKIWVTKAKIAKRTDGHRNDNAARQYAEKDDKINIPYTNEDRLEQLKDIGYDLEF